MTCKRYPQPSGSTQPVMPRPRISDRVDWSSILPTAHTAVTTQEDTPMTTTTPSRARHDTTTDQDQAVRPFTIDVPETALADLRQRLSSTRWPDELPDV